MGRARDVARDSILGTLSGTTIEPSVVDGPTTTRMDLAGLFSIVLTDRDDGVRQHLLRRSMVGRGDETLADVVVGRERSKSSARAVETFRSALSKAMDPYVPRSVDNDAAGLALAVERILSADPSRGAERIAEVLARILSPEAFSEIASALEDVDPEDGFRI